MRPGLKTKKSPDFDLVSPENGETRSICTKIAKNACTDLTKPAKTCKIFPNVYTIINIGNFFGIFRDFETQIKPLPAFNLNDIRNFDPDFHRPQLSDWINREFIKPLAGGYYVLADSQMDESLVFMLANLIYEPSYISRESALAYYQIIPESVLGVTSTSSRKTKQFNTQWGVFSYRSIKPSLMFGYIVIEKGQNTKFKIARLEKAILDYLYWNPDLQSVEDLEGLRFNKDLISDLEDNTLFRKYLRIFNSKTLDRRVKIMMEYAHA